MARRKTTPRRRKAIKRRSRSPRRVTKRRMTTKRKSPPSTRIGGAYSQIKRVKKNPISSSGFASHHAVRINAFSDATAQPKIPDGNFTSSLSRRCQNVKAFTTNDSVIHLIYAPTLGCPLTITKTTDGASFRPGMTLQASFLGFPGQTVGFEAVVGGSPKWPLVSGDSPDITNTGGFAGWRVVSQGLRLELDATEEQNDGWFEACRFNWRRENSDVVFTPLDGTTTSTAIGAAPNPNLPDLYASAMVELPGYQTGLLKDLKKMQFHLHPQKGDHEPVLLTRTNHLSNADGDLTPDSGASNFTLEATPMGNSIVNQVVDSNMDWLYIRIHPRSVANGGSKLIVNMTQNLEINYDPASDLAAFQTINKRDPKVEKVVDGINNNQTAGGPRRKL